jgi:hypothetical protein
VGARNSAHIMRTADIRGSGRRAGRAVGCCGSRLRCGREVVVLGSGLTEGAVWPVVVVMACVLLEHGCGVTVVDDHDMVEEFAADGADQAFGDGVCSRRPHRCLDNPDVDRGEDGIEGVGELGVAVADEEPETLDGT